MKLQYLNLKRKKSKMVNKTERGFCIFDENIPNRMGTVSVVESSLAFSGPYVRIYSHDDNRGGVHLSVEAAQRVINALNQFIIMALCDKLCEPYANYKRNVAP
jgi:hypothetical protein